LTALLLAQMEVRLLPVAATAWLLLITGAGCAADKVVQGAVGCVL